MSFAEQIIEHGPYDETVHPRYGAETYVHTGAQLNELRAELIAARNLREVLGRYEVSAFTVTGVPADVVLDHDCARWAIHIDQPIPLAELVQRAEEHTEVCR